MDGLKKVSNGLRKVSDGLRKVLDDLGKLSEGEAICTKRKTLVRYFFALSGRHFTDLGLKPLAWAGSPCTRWSLEPPVSALTDWGLQTIIPSCVHIGRGAQRYNHVHYFWWYMQNFFVG